MSDYRTMSTARLLRLRVPNAVMWEVDEELNRRIPIPEEGLKRVVSFKYKSWPPVEVRDEAAKRGFTVHGFNVNGMAEIDLVETFYVRVSDEQTGAELVTALSTHEGVSDVALQRDGFDPFARYITLPEGHPWAEAVNGGDHG